MYPSVKVHYENGNFILDEPMPVKGNVRGVFVILEANPVKNQINNPDFFANSAAATKAS